VDVEGIDLAEGVGESRQLFLHYFHGGFVHELHSLQNVTELLLGETQNALATFIRGHSQNCEVLRGGHGRAEHGTLGDDAKSTFTSNEEVLEVVTGIVLPQSSHVVEDLTVCHDSLEADTIGVHRVKFDEVNSTSVSC